MSKCEKDVVRVMIQRNEGGAFDSIVFRVEPKEPSFSNEAQRVSEILNKRAELLARFGVADMARDDNPNVAAKLKAYLQGYVKAHWDEIVNLIIQDATLLTDVRSLLTIL